MMPSLKKKQEEKTHKNTWFKKFPKGLILEIALYLCDKYKIALKLMRVNKIFRAQCSNNRVWYFFYATRFPETCIKLCRL